MTAYRYRLTYSHAGQQSFLDYIKSYLLNTQPWAFDDPAIPPHAPPIRKPDTDTTLSVTTNSFQDEGIVVTVENARTGKSEEITAGGRATVTGEKTFSDLTDVRLSEPVVGTINVDTADGTNLTRLRQGDDRRTKSSYIGTDGRYYYFYEYAFSTDMIRQNIEDNISARLSSERYEFLFHECFHDEDKECDDYQTIAVSNPAPAAPEGGP